jgi:hypothetical protein
MKHLMKMSCKDTAAQEASTTPVQVGCIMGRRMSTKYPHIPHNKPHSKETVKGHPEVISISLGPITKSQSATQFNVKNRTAQFNTKSVLMPTTDIIQKGY